ncbi:acyltransferase [Acidisphaera sp. S103]|uniref:acyltransferase family protein n=1 Tax=Acidisphaera sp. S103 TaxID=1747223 RepID=UPI00131BFB74|nr:acyltransferase family protein [Acidisphaera sp. S103]
MDGLRGIGAVQVCLFHLSPAFGFDAPYGPALVAFDGQLAVFIFFFISGVGLAGWANSDFPRWTRLIVARAARLFIPSMAACLFAFGVWIILLPFSPQVCGLLPASKLTASVAAKFLTDIFMFMPLLGHRDSSLFLNVPWLGMLIRQHAFTIGPLWTISIEFYGSLVVLTLAASKRFSKCVVILAVFIALLLTLRSILFPFVVGFVMFHARNRIRFNMPILVTLAVLSGGFFISIAASNNVYFSWAEWIARVSFMVPAQSSYSVQKCAAALLIFCVIFLSPEAKMLLSNRFFRFLGSVSFPLYLTHFPLLMIFWATDRFLLARGMPTKATVYLSLVPYTLCLCAAIAIFRQIDTLSINASRAIVGRRRTDRATIPQEQADLAA